MSDSVPGPHADVQEGETARPDGAQSAGQSVRLRDGRTSKTHQRRRKSEVRQRTEVVVFRLLPGERELLATAAAERDISLSELIRSSVLNAIER
jgi:hypothetical protein